MSPVPFIGAVLKDSARADIMGSAAALSYYALFAVFPFLFFLVTLTAYLPLKGAVDGAIRRIAPLVPKQALEVVTSVLTDVLTRPHPRLLAVALAVSVLSASKAMNAARVGLNRAYGVVEHRPWWFTGLLAVEMTVLVAVLLFLSAGVLVLGGRLGGFIFGHLHMGEHFHAVWRSARWPILTLFVLFTAAVSYTLLPDRPRRFRLLSLGAAFATASWLLASWGFSFYADHFSKVNVTYGSIGGVILLLSWFYLSALIFFGGGVTNAVLERAAAEKRARRGEVPAPPPSSKSRRRHPWIRRPARA
jgi:membrane protein